MALVGELCHHLRPAGIKEEGAICRACAEPKCLLELSPGERYASSLSRLRDAEIRRVYEQEEISRRALAKRFHISCRTVLRILGPQKKEAIKIERRADGLRTQVSASQVDRWS